MVLDAAGPGFQSHFEDNAIEGLDHETQQFYGMLDSSNKPLFKGCDAHTELSMAMRMMSIKTDYNAPQGLINEFLQLAREFSPKEELCIPEDFYRTKKVVKNLGLKHLTYDCCINGCMLYYKDDENMEACRFCEAPRFKPRRKGNRRYKNVLFKKMHYLPLIPRLQRLYASPSSAQHMRWHYEHKRPEGVMCHPSDGKAWKHFDKVHQIFSEDPRNVRLGLCADGFNPYGIGASSYSCWPVVVTPYNMPPHMCLTAPFMFLTCVILGPKNPKALIDVYLQLLIDELKILWEGVPTYDISTNQNFLMKAALMWTINDFPAYGMLSGWSTAGVFACPHCMEKTKAFYLKFGHKPSWFDCHRQWLPASHPFRDNVTAFYKNRVEKGKALKRLTGEEMWERVGDMPKATNYGSWLPKLPGYGQTHNWKKKTIFWDLIYWKDNLLPHNLDPMHIEKNVFDNIFNTVMNLPGSKDNPQARQVLAAHCDRDKLHLRSHNGRNYKLKAIFSFSNKQRSEVLTWIKEDLRMPDGYASNISRGVNVE
ncbi:uncharacterized protein [Rutidosis leptorrhynchoides]|uniref:uncharacterized protein n=1 Tax=Rutidosis leptorrhynchoides TaxID=125765 RepID=UPI003A9A46AA